MARRYLVQPLPDAGTTTLSAELGHHLGRVLRVTPGTELTLFDGQGNECRALVTQVVRDQVVVKCQAAEASKREPKVQVEVAFALPKGARADWLFEHATEAGIARFRPVIVARSSNPEPATGRRARWLRIVAAAAGQCDRARLPEVDELVSFAEFLASDLPKLRIIATPQAPPLRPVDSDVVILVGPEGGFTPAELEAANATGFQAAGLGPLILRTETAVLAAVVRALV